MPAFQTLLLPDPRPLVERLGRDFFRQLPPRPGVYLMHDASDTVLYVGKARNLRQRLRSYRVANPDRMPRRHLRLLRAVNRIEIQECPDESAALTREAELLRSLKPKFNRAGTWPSPPRFVVCRCDGERFEFSVTQTPDAGGPVFGPLGGGAIGLCVVLVRLVWFFLHPARGIAGMPAGWVHGNHLGNVVVNCGAAINEVAALLEPLRSGQAEVFCDSIRSRMGNELHPFEKAAVESNLESIAEMFAVRRSSLNLLAETGESRTTSQPIPSVSRVQADLTLALR